MRSSVSSSTTATRSTTPPGAPPHKAFALVGRSRAYDPTREAIRPDVADVRLAERIFAPHYAAPLPRRVLATTTLRTARPADSAALAILGAGEMFELLDLTGETGWGIAPKHGLVGYIDARAIGPVA